MGSTQRHAPSKNSIQRKDSMIWQILKALGFALGYELLYLVIWLGVTVFIVLWPVIFVLIVIYAIFVLLFFSRSNLDAQIEKLDRLQKRFSKLGKN
jgi:hypothetical protein